MSAFKLPAADAPASEWGALAARIPGWKCRTDLIGWAAYRVDPDHWAWEGWMLRLLGDTFAHIATDGPGYVVCIIVDGGTIEGTGTTIGRACIAAAAALGRWPGGGA